MPWSGSLRPAPCHSVLTSCQTSTKATTAQSGPLPFLRMESFMLLVPRTAPSKCGRIARVSTDFGEEVQQAAVSEAPSRKAQLSDTLALPQATRSREPSDDWLSRPSACPWRDRQLYLSSAKPQRESGRQASFKPALLGAVLRAVYLSGSCLCNCCAYRPSAYAR